MCGIAGFIGSTRFYPTKHSIIKCKLKMKRRGPDNFGIKEFRENNNSYLFMHSRLSIIDPVQISNQPMEDENGILIFNGEIYNYIELRKHLKEKKYVFKTNSDTEVLLKMLAYYGTKSVDMLDGMWAFCYYNKKKKETYISRDRFGEKPLYILKHQNNLYFGSNINYLLTLYNNQLPINFKKIENYLNFGFRTIDLKNSTFFKDIYNLEPNTIVRFSEKKFVKKNFWNFKKVKIDRSTSFEDSKIILKETFVKSLNRRLRSDFPIACLLSGGIDSSSIASASKKLFDINLDCYSIKSFDKNYDETNLINKTIKKYGLKHKYIPADKNFSYSNISNIIKDGAYPISSITFLLYFFLNKAIKKNNIRVLMSGIGADELFAGYYTHQMYYLFASETNYNFKSIYNDWKKYVRPLVRNKNLRDFNYYKNSIKRIPHVFAANDITTSKRFKSKSRINIPKDKFFKDYFKNQLANDMLLHNVPPQIRDSDQISMFFGIENRSPFLSKDLFELAYSFKNNYLINKGYGKYILRQAMKKIVDDEILRDRNKVGFNMNIQSIFKTNSKRFKEEIFKSDDLNKILNEKELTIILDKEKLNNQESHMLFSILNVANFLDLYA